MSRKAKSNVRADGIIGEEYLLRDIPDVRNRGSPPLLLRTSDLNLAVLRPQQTENDINQRALSGTGCANNAHRGT